MRQIIYALIIVFSFVNVTLGASGIKYNNNHCKNNTPNVYLGAQLAYAFLDYGKKWAKDNNIFTTVRKVENSNWAGRVYLGYSFYPSFAGELGYIYFHEVIFKDTNTSSREKFIEEAFDFLVKGTKYTSVYNNIIGIYGKIGLAWIHREKINANDTLSHGRLTPAFSIGVNYELTPNIETELSYNKYVKTRDLQAAEFLALGLAYKFF